ncbi:MAG: 50S ribosomal protein L15e [Euryarchaeota archaeon]|nr:50S ribosomal protein L15e [Euryarchaeota archaeon]
MSKAAYKYLADAWKKPDRSFQSPNWHRLIEWRAGESFVRVERPLRLDRAHALGYKAKPGYVIVRARVRRGGLRKTRFDGGRMPSKMGMLKITQKKNIQWIAEERTNKRFPNLQVLNSYWVGEDGLHKYYEIILVDPFHPAVANDNRINFVSDPANKKRVLRGKTSAGQRARGLRWTGKGSEKARPSVRKSKVREGQRRYRIVRKNFNNKL